MIGRVQNISADNSHTLQMRSLEYQSVRGADWSNPGKLEKRFHLERSSSRRPD